MRADQVMHGMHSLRDRTLNNRLRAATVVFAAYTVVMMRLDDRMRAAGGPGIIAFELAGTATGAEEIMARWGESGQRAARLSMRLDFGYMSSYGMLLALLVERRRRRSGHPSWLPATAAGAVVFDAVEGVALLRVLDRRLVAVNAGRARVAALVKFAIIALTLGYSLYPARPGVTACS
ncbi:MAG: hypothetical protein AB1925_05760 [Actinomycetota bacterium]